MNKIKPLDITIKRTAINGKLVESVDFESYGNNPNKYLGRDDVGIEIEDNGNTLVLPLKDSYNGNPISPGIYYAGEISFTVLPDKLTYNKYIPEQTITLSNKLDAKKIIENSELINRLDEPFITTPDSITRIPVTSLDEPEMKALKEMINNKNIDLDTYSSRFGANYPNDKRQLKENSATLKIIKRFCNNLDVEALLVLRNKNDNVPNPLDKEIVVSLTESYNE